ncbi:MAG: hypothetical protein JWM28_746 [Chitinophagaceae bacterium]|nr:hypothetical protein [Chitinophagaceae bacterium]
MIAIFKDLADKSTAAIAVIKDDHEALRKHFGITDGNYFAMTMVTDAIIQGIKTALEPSKNEPPLKRKELLDLVDALVYDSVLAGVDNSDYLTLLQIIISKEPLYKTLSNTTAWSTALNEARNYRVISPDIYSVKIGSLRDHFAKAFDIGSAALALRKLGCRVDISGTQLEFSSGLEQVVGTLEKQIIAYGPVAFIQAIFSFLVHQHIYVPEYRRYLVKNDIAFAAMQVFPMLPFGYLLNLAVKHIGKPELPLKPSKARELMTEIERIAKHLGSIADARAYNIWEIQHQSADTLLDNIRAFALFDANFAFPSSDISDTIDYMEHLFSWLEDEAFINLYDFSKNDVVAVTKVIDLLTTDNGPQIIYTSAIQKQLKHLSIEKLTTILAYLSHLPNQINQEFILTEHYNKCTFGSKPLIALTPTKFLLCDKSWCAAAFYEVLATLVRGLDTKDNESNKKIGPALEQFVYEKFNKKGIDVLHGNYATGSVVKGEADGLVETENAIVLFEIKKKVLTRRSKTGSAVALIIDLAGSLLEAQVQAGRTELLLRQKGFIELENAGQITRIDFKDREIERLAISQWDFGSFQDRSIINSILSILINTEYTLIKEDSKSDADNFKKMQKLRKEHEIQAGQLQKVDSRFDHYPYFSCWFLSVPQIMVLLRYSNNNEEFYAALRATKSVTMSTMNFYFEFLHSFIRSPRRTGGE